MKTFMIRESAMKQEHYYVDFNGEYEISGISSCTGITENAIRHVYEKNEGIYDADRNVYYFLKYGYAAEAINELRGNLKPARVGRTVTLTEKEIEYIRKALINEDSNIIYTKSKIRDSIFDKLNQ